MISNSESFVQHLVDRKGRLWQERTVTVKPNSSSYGFSLSGEKPVFIESVVEGGPAHKAGLKAGDRIIKVDGQTVYDKKHPEVVLLLKGATSVSLTVITQYSRSPRELSGSQKIQELTLNALKAMLDRQQKTYEQLTLEYTKSPSEKIEQELKGCEELIKTLRAEIGIKANSAVENMAHTTEASITTLLGPDKASERRGKLARDDSVLANKLLNSGSNTVNDDSSEMSPNLSTNHSSSPLSMIAQPTPTGISASTNRFKSPKMFRKGSLSKIFLNTTNSAMASNSETAATSRSRSSSPTKPLVQPHVSAALNDSDLSDEDLEFGTLSQYGPFCSLQELNNYPAHMSIFLHYLIQNRDAKYLCFYLVAQSFQNNYKGSDLKQKALEIMWTFCLPTSPLYVGLDESIYHKIFVTLECEDTEMKLKSVFVESRDIVAQKIAQDLTNYRHKRTLGLGSIYGEQLLTDHMTNARELEVTTSTLLKILKDLLNEKLYTSEDVNRNYALTISVYTFLMDITKGKAKLDFSLTERNQSFTRPETNKRKVTKNKKLSKCGHSFQLMMYNRTMYCDHCERMLWGIMYQGYQCTTCEMNIHRYGCIDETIDSCIGRKKERKANMSRRVSGGLQSNLLTSSDGDKNVDNVQNDSGDGPVQDDDESAAFNERHRSISEPKHTQMLIKEREHIPEEPKKKSKHVTVNRTQSLKERRSHPDAPQGSQDTSLNTTPSWNSVASSSSMSDESLNSSTLPAGLTNFSNTTVNRLDTVVETTSGRTKSPLLDDEALQELIDADFEEELIPWKLTSKSEVVKKLQNFEIQRQELLKELIHTEKTHLRKLQIMKHIYKNPLSKQGILTAQQVENLFPCLDELVAIHSELCKDMKDCQVRSADGVVRDMADILLQRFDEAFGERLCHACSVFASNQGKAEKLIKEHTMKNPKFKKFLQDAESNPYCNRLTLKELLPIVWTRLTRYRLLMDSIMKLDKKNEKKLKPEDKEESDKLATALTCLKDILTHVNKHVRQSENRQRLHEYQMRLDVSHIERTTHPILEKYKDLNLTSEDRELLHEGLLTWNIFNRKIVVQALLLNDILVLVSPTEDGSDKLHLKRYYKDKGSGIREEFSSIIRLKEMILRHFSIDKGGRSFLIVNNSPLMTAPQMYEFSAENVQEKRKWEELIGRAMKGTLTSVSPDLSLSLEESFSKHVVLNPLMSNTALRDQLDKIDNGIQKLLDDKLSMLRGLQGIDRQDTLSASLPSDAKGVIENTTAILKTVGELTAQVSKLMVPNPTKYIVADVQYQLAELTGQLHTEFSGLLATVGESSTNLLTANDRSEDKNVLSVTSTTPQLDAVSDTTVSPSDDQYLMININESTPNATPLPNGTYNYLLPHVPADDYKDGNESDEEGPPPPLPQKPPPSSSSASSATPPDVLDEETLPIQLPRAISEYSVGLEDFQSESLTRILEPPEGFNEYLVTNSLTGASTHQRLTEAPPIDKGGGFRRVRSNPALASNKIMSVISSVGGSNQTSPVKKVNNEDMLDNEYIMTIQQFTPDS